MRLQMRVLALIAAALAVICVGLAIAFRQAREETLCWRAFVADGERPPEGDCARIR